VKINRREKTAQILLPSLPRISLGRLRLGKGDRPHCQLMLTPGKTKIAWGHGAAVRQLYRGQEVGRVVWQFAPRAVGKDQKKEPGH
jgi:hypothetical protein